MQSQIQVRITAAFRRNERAQSTTLKDVVLNAIQRDSRTRENRAKSIVVPA